MVGQLTRDFFVGVTEKLATARKSQNIHLRITTRTHSGPQLQLKT
jgi:hypothetical protein